MNTRGAAGARTISLGAQGFAELRENGYFYRFARTLLSGDLDAMNDYLGDVAWACVSSFDAGTRPDGRGEPEQIDAKAYRTALIERGIDENRIRAYGIAFRSKEVLVG